MKGRWGENKDGMFRFWIAVSIVILILRLRSEFYLMMEALVPQRHQEKC